ncbi:hypothetical protein NliqN6_6686 [Naganishia liquefaciens]|uniref:Lysosomal dipeptide transporter MFSD1 n=1 Tax=Naganishia liquefaciens TaxID=104408 RepID=A0A8H3U049_9TREE|nr:hypothetical protein NliqN6_6686 [Naganishia liquefaciens]
MASAQYKRDDDAVSSKEGSESMASTEAHDGPADKTEKSHTLNLPTGVAVLNNGDHDADSSMGLQESGTGAVVLPWRLKVPALVLVIFFTLGSNYTQSSLSPLKSTIRKQVPGVTNAKYGVISSSDQLINGVLPIFSGIIIDYYGPSFGSLASSTFILLGAVVRAIGGQKASFPIILGGQILFGIGSTTIETAQSKLYTHWYRGTAKGGRGWIGFVYGLDIAMGRVFNLSGNLSAIPITQSTGKWYFAFWVGAILCAVTLGLNIAYVLIERSLPKEARIVTGIQVARQARQKAEVDKKSVSSYADESLQRPLTPFSKEHFKFVAISIKAIPAAFWFIAISQLLQAGVVGAYSSNLSETIENTRGTTKLTAGYTSAIGQIIPIVMTPLVGLCFDLFGRRMWFVSATAALWVVVFSLLAYSSVHPLVPVILGSVALSSNAIPFIASIPLLVPSQACIGTAFGLWKALNSAGSTVVDIAVGAIQDRAPAGKSQYDNMFYFMIALKAVDILYGAGYHFVDKKYFGGVLRLNEADRVKKEAMETEADRRQGLRPAIKGWTIFGLVVAVCLIATSYVLYIVYSM